jgi:hypothetical protein
MLLTRGILEVSIWRKLWRKIIEYGGKTNLTIMHLFTQTDSNSNIIHDTMIAAASTGDAIFCTINQSTNRHFIRVP